MHISTVYDRTNLINTTTRTVRHVVFTGLFLVTLVLISMLGDLRISFIAAITIPFAVLFAFSMMVLTGQSANLISIGAIDFGILVDASIVVLESIYRKLSRRTEDENNIDLIIEGASNAAKPVLFATLIILVAFIPLFTMQGVPGKIFAPMSVTYGFALTGALIFSLIFAPVLAQLIVPTQLKQEKHETFLGSFLRRRYDKGLPRVLAHRPLTWMVALVCLVASGILFTFVGGEFMPPLEEGNLWIRATLPQDISFDAAARIGDELRAQIAKSPEVTQAVSQMGRPDDGTDVVTFNDVEVSVALKPPSEWRPGLTKNGLIDEINHRLSRIPGMDLNFSQNIQDNVEEAMSGVKGENSLKLFGDDFDTLSRLANQITQVMQSVRGVADVGVFRVGGQPSLLIRIDRAKAARYGLAAADVNATIQAAVGGAAVTQIIEGDRRFDLTVRFPERYRNGPDAIQGILLPTPDGRPGAHRPDCRCRDARRRLHDLSRKRPPLYSHQVQRARPRSGHHHSGSAAAIGRQDKATVRLQLHLGRRVRQLAQRTAPSRLHHPHKPGSDSDPALHPIPHLERRAHRARHLALRSHRWRTGLVSHPHPVQYFRRRRLHFADRSCHLGSRRLPLRHPPCPGRRRL